MKTITFYSYKGGVGRSLTLANIALRLSEFNKKVCLIDFDLEAPGLPLKFSKYIKSEIEKGLVDYIYEYSHKGILPKSIADYSIKFDINKNSMLHLIPAGNVNSSDYWKKLSSIDWYNLLYENPNSISFFLDLKQKIKKEISPDFLLIDARTGISEMSGITISLLADDVVIVSANNEENLFGCKKIIDSLLDAENSLLGKTPKITFILSRIPFTEHPEDRVKEQTLTAKIQNQLQVQLNDNFFVLHSDPELELNEQLKISNEIIDGTSVQITRDYLKLFQRLTKDVLTQDDIERFEKIKQSEALYIQSTHERSFDKKLSLVTSAITLNPINIEYLYYRSYLNEIMGDHEKAISDLQIICETDSSFKPTALNRIGEICLSIERYDEAINCFSANYPYGLVGLGDTFMAMGLYEDAVTNYTEAIQHDPDHFEAYNSRANAFIRLEQIGDATRDAFKALEIDPNDPMGCLTLAKIYALTKQINEFYLWVEHALKSDRLLVRYEIENDELFAQFYHQKRFVKLLDKYNIDLDAPF
jgi:tetratricopeptide (TPR) repeat protein